MKHGCFLGASVLTDGKVLVIGGQVNESVPIISAELYDPATGSWTFTNKLNHARDGHTVSALTNGKALVTGGYEGDIQDSAELYVPETKNESNRNEL